MNMEMMMMVVIMMDMNSSLVLNVFSIEQTSGRQQIERRMIERNRNGNENIRRIITKGGTGL